MTPSPGSSSKAENENLTIKQQRAANRARKVEEFRRRQKRSTRNRRLGIIGGIIATVAIAGVLISSIVTTSAGPKNSANSRSAKVEGVQTFTNAAGHSTTSITYDQTPPAGGLHNPVWLNCGVYTKPVLDENAVHSLEHGAIWATYDPSLSATELNALRSKLPSTYVVVSPYENLPSRIVLSGWNVQLQIESADDKRLATFFAKYWKSGTSPEPGAACTGGVDGPGKVS